nr:hypothetical protein [Tanacetum cinerariifolium]
VFDEEPKAPVEALQPLEYAPPLPDYMPGPEHPSSPDYVLDDASPAALSSSYVADFDPEEDPKEDHADGRDKKEEESFEDDADDEDEEYASKDDDEEEEERLASADSTTLLAVDPIPSAEDTEAFEIDESVPTPHVPSPRLHKARICKRARFTAPTSRFEVGESSSAAAARQDRHTLAYRVDYGFIDTVDASICTSESRAITAVGKGNQARNGNAVTKAYVVGTAGANPNSNVVTSTFLLNNRYASNLFDIRADRSFVSIAFSSLIDIIPTTLDHGYDIELADGFVNPKHPKKVCKLQHSIYVLKQASRSWNKRFDEEIKKISFTQNPDEPCVYLKSSGINVAFLILYVDNILLMGNNVTMLKEVTSWLCKCFSIKDLGEATYILGIKIIRDRSKRLIALSQSAYLEKILKKFRMKNFKKGYTPIMEKHVYRKSQGAKTHTEVNICREFLMLRLYVQSCMRPEDKLKVSCYADASFQTDKAIQNLKRDMSSMEAVWMRKFIDGLGGVMPSNKRPMEMLCDNEPALAIASDLRILKGARDFQRKYHYICEVIQEGEIILKNVHTYDNVANPFTKPMPLNKHFEHDMSIGIDPASSLM